ncbi:hypothetical protein [Bradyrhizobium cenepequi]|uniref:hypothetical protein n=1 Tax=Bradyrhizobium cenepequi TaxID=2821403 RepID=UPI001CE31D13|nr:hypothetical protein [Bradyrhizobium cenepequi]MCA6111995.1 hypothetical protein [Bradyrhizobium cenepequi]
MPEATRTLSTSTANLHRKIKEISDAVGKLLVDAFHLLALFAIGATTVWSAVATFIGMLAKGHANLSDILLLFIYLERDVIEADDARFSCLVQLTFLITRPLRPSPTEGSRIGSRSGR